MSTSQKKVILVIDDQAHFREAVQFELDYLGYSTVSAEDGEKGFQAIVAGTIDLVLSDLRMPNWDGDRLLTELRKISRQIPPLIFMTGHSDLSAEDAYDRGADGVIAKPFDPQDFADVVAKFLLPISERWSMEPADTESHLLKMELATGIDETTPYFQLGRGGFLVRQEAFPSVLRTGETVRFEIQFSTGPVSQLKGKGIVKWLRNDVVDAGKNLCGIEFTWLHVDSRDVTIGIIQKRCMLRYIPVRFESEAKAV